MKLGVAFNVFDGHELLERAVACIRPFCGHLVIVYQTISNFGQPCHPDLVPLLTRLKEQGLVDELLQYPSTDAGTADPSALHFAREQKRRLTSPFASLTDVGGSTAEIAEQFLHELCKREVGRAACAATGCELFMTMDCDEFYRPEQLQFAIQFMEDNPVYEACACLMRYFYKSPTLELLPPDEKNYALALCRLRPESEFLLAHPYPVLVDPTRTLKGVRRLKVFSREELQMYHFSMVRSPWGILSKLANVSNRSNYLMQPQEFLERLAGWTPESGGRPPHPHPFFAKTFSSAALVPNWFAIPDVFTEGLTKQSQPQDRRAADAA
eukprot:RCo040358